MEKKSYVQVYTGAGKGKTTAAIGLSIRALGAGKKVSFIQFMKGLAYSEQSVLMEISPDFKLKTVGKPFFIAKKESVPEEVLKELGDDCVVFSEGNPPAEYVELVRKGMEEAIADLRSGAYDLVVLDEICCAIYFGLIEEDEVIAAIESRAEKTEVVLTGRNASETLIAYADLVTEMREIKHYYNRGVKARRGIEN